MRRQSPSLLSKAKHNMKFAALMIGICAVLGLGISIATQGLEGVIKRANIAMRAMENPNQLSASEKSEIKKLMGGGNKASAKAAFDKLTPEEKTRAKEQFGALSEDQKKQYKGMFGK